MALLDLVAALARRNATLALVLRHRGAHAALPRRLRRHRRRRRRRLHAVQLAPQCLARLARLVRRELLLRHRPRRRRLRALPLVYAHLIDALALERLALGRLRAAVAPAALLRHRLPAVVEDHHARRHAARLQRREPRLDARRVDGAVEGVPRAPAELVELARRLLLRAHAEGAQPRRRRAQRLLHERVRVVACRHEQRVLHARGAHVRVAALQLHEELIALAAHRGAEVAADERQHEGVGVGAQLEEEELAQARRDPLGWCARGHWLLARCGGRANQSAVEGECCGGRALWRAAWLACVSTGTSAALLPQFGPIHQRFVREAARNRSQDSFPSDATCSPRSVAPVKSRKRPRSSDVPEVWSVFCKSRSSSYSTPPTVANSEPRCSWIGATSVDWTDRAV